MGDKDVLHEGYSINKEFFFCKKTKMIFSIYMNFAWFGIGL